MENIFYVYVYFDPSRDLEAFYIGKGKDNRSHCHLSRVDKHPLTQRLQKMSREGIIPNIERYEGLSEEAAFNLEIELIKEIGRKDLGTGPLLNLTNGGEGVSGYIFSEEHKNKLSEAGKNRIISEETKIKISETLTGSILSEERRLKISETLKKFIPTLETRNKISVANTGKVRSDEMRKKYSLAKMGIIHTGKSKQNFSDGQLNMPKETREQVAFSRKNNFWKIKFNDLIFTSLEEFARVLNLNHQMVYKKIKKGEIESYLKFKKIPFENISVNWKIR